MRIHRLEISAFGPFAGTEQIDFDRLSAHGLFLLNGPTGAGKTSVLDAICFALYGSVPGARQDGKRLRSDHAETGAEPRVTCEFSARGRHFEVSRAPAWDKPSSRGKNGFTVQQANTLLRERVDGVWVEKSGRNDEAGAEITDVLGMNRDQFTRVVMLPQGDFAAFLRSKAADRLDLLQSLFGTQRFEAVEAELSRKAQLARAELASLNSQLELLLARAEAETAALELDTAEAPDGTDADGRLAWLKTQTAAAAADRKEAAVAAELLRAGHAATLDAATSRAARQARLDAALARRSAAEASASALTLKADQLGLHRKAEVLSGQLQAVVQAEAAEELAAAAMAGAARELDAAAAADPELVALRTAGTEDATGSGAPTGARATAALRTVLGDLRSVRAVLNAGLPNEEKLSGLKARDARLSQALGGLRGARDAAQGTSDALRAESETLLAGLRPLEELAAEVQLRVKEAESAEELVIMVGRYAAAETACLAVTERRGRARDGHQERRQHWLDLREERLANAAAELASQLRAGVPCAVCGSTDHPLPAPAAASALAVAEAEQAAEHACAEAEAALAAVERDLADAQREVAVLAAQGGTTAAEDARLDAVLARDRAAEAVRAADDLAASRARQSALEEEIAAAGRAAAAAVSDIAQTESTIVAVREQAVSLELALNELRAGHPTLGERIAALDGATAVLERTDTARARLETAQTRTAEALTSLEQALPAAGFDSAGSARAVLLPADVAAALEAEIRAGQDEAARIGELFASEDVTLAAQERETDGPVAGDVVPALRLEYEAAERFARDTALASGLAGKSVQTLGRIAADYAALAEAGRAPRDRAALLAAVADAARGAGDNTYRMSLNTYVLAARLEQVALAASERLTGMSDGRYTLQHTDAKAARGAKSGLGLEVVDEWTGQRRDTATLSGGESFMASLALALGLADVVQQESGGVDIETLFVDEGFGSLDEQALEQVMDALEGLRDGGRVVGLVSHVGEMKQRIGTQLQVLKGRNGSTLHIADDANG
ncbi:AAA family ATPase [Arthrobacter sp. PAMC25284]|uniref:AAA family ATPase n=1 Tax=Arthrobacter sp. PAMC25284 TaxID=2861279 RepID=UPI001C62E559|nr:SMC family ATPase [Arthrobacter sp. PAMC25284]QYF89817.1 SMC family ATPase [Arthrobacter sp. PAMC25284]